MFFKFYCFSQGKWDAEEIVLQYSKDGGVSWQTMQVIKNLSLNQVGKC